MTFADQVRPALGMVLLLVLLMSAAAAPSRAAARLVDGEAAASTREEADPPPPGRAPPPPACLAPSLIAPADSSVLGSRNVTLSWNSISGCTFTNDDLVAMLTIPRDITAGTYTFTHSGGSMSRQATFTIGSTLPDLIPSTAGGTWQLMPAVPSSVSGTDIVNLLSSSQPTYIDWHVENRSGSSISSTFYVELWVGSTRHTRYPFNGFAAYLRSGFNDWRIEPNVIPPGFHTARLIVDPENTVTESNEANNVYEETFYWAGTAPTAMVSIPGAQPWTDTGRDIPAGSNLLMSAGGVIQLDAIAIAGQPPRWGSCIATAGYLVPGLGCGALIARIGNGTPFQVGFGTEITVTAGGRLYLGVNDTNHADNSGAWTAWLYVVTPLATPPPPIVTPNPTNITLTWPAVSGATSYRIAYTRSAPISYQWVEVIGTTWTLQNAVPGDIWYFHLSACNGAGCSGLSGAAAGTTGSNPPVPPNLRVGVTTDRSIQILWGNVSGESLFQVAWTRTSPINYQFVTVPADATTWTHDPLPSWQSNYYHVRACNGVNCSAWFYGIGATALAFPATPSGLRLSTVTDTTIQVQWNDVSSEMRNLIARTRSSPIGYQFPELVANTGTRTARIWLPAASTTSTSPLAPG